MDPNVLLIVLDTARADHTSVHGYERPTTSRLEELASDSVRFDEAFSAAPWTPPSHGSIFTGVYPSSHQYLDFGMPFTPPHPPLAELLTEKGYQTFGAVQTSNLASTTEVTRGFSEYGELYRVPFVPDSIEEFKSYYLDLLPGYLELGRGSLGSGRKPAEYLCCEYLQRRIRNAAGETSFFGFINILSPHSKYAPPEPYRSRFASRRANRPSSGAREPNRSASAW